MKKLLLFLLPAATSIVAMAQQTEPYATKTFPASSVSRIESSTSGGNIQVTGSDAGEARLEVYVEKSWNQNLSKDEIQRRLKENYDVRWEVSGGTLYAVTKPNKHNMDWKREGLSVSYRMVVPHASVSKLTTSGGNISLSDLSGDQEFTTSGGNIDVVKMSGKLKGTTSGGNIHAKEITRDVELITSGGNIDAENGKGDIKLITSGGSVHLRDLSGKVTATTSGGNVTVENTDGELNASTSGGHVHLSHVRGDIAASTSGGNIDAQVDEVGKYVHLDNSGGHISLTIPGGKGLQLDVVAERIRTVSLNNFAGTTAEGTLRGTVKGGGAEVRIRGGSSVTLDIK
jgi:DUF4097 and DUF4098 domain-containing protein YvlB